MPRCALRAAGRSLSLEPHPGLGAGVDPPGSPRREKLLGKHASVPFNPDVAHVFFRSGMIEAWGRGIERILGACRDAGTPEPEISYERTGLWIVFRYLPEHSLNVTGEVTDQVTDQVERLVAVLMKVRKK